MTNHKQVNSIEMRNIHYLTIVGAFALLGVMLAVTVATAQSTTASAPLEFKATASTATTVTLSWKSVTNAHGYKVEYATSRSGPWAVAFYDITRTSHKAYALECDTLYYFRISARGDGSPYSTSYGATSTGRVSKRTSACPTTSPRTAPAPTGLDVTSRTQTIVRVAWNSVTDAARYKTERSETGSGLWSTVRFEVSGTRRNDTGLTCGTTYYYRVRARGDGSPYSTTYGVGSRAIPVTTLPCTRPTPTPTPTPLPISSPTTANTFDVDFRDKPGLGDKVVTDNDEQHEEVTPSSPATSVKFNVALTVSATSAHKRAYTIKVEAKYSGSSVWVPVDSIVNHNSAAIDDYQDLGGGQAVWIEDSQTVLSFAVAAYITPAPQRYKITIAKPDIALMKRPERVDTADETTRGNLKLRVKIRNSAAVNSDDDSNSIEVFCVDPQTDGAKYSRRYTFKDLRASGESHLIGIRERVDREKEVLIPTVCRGVTSPGIPQTYVTLNPRSELSLMASGTFSWPFDSDITVWSSQSPVTGGLQMSGFSSGEYKASPCTLSFTLGLVGTVSTLTPTPTPISAVSTTAHCTENRHMWRQGAIPLVSGNTSNSQSAGSTFMMPTPLPTPTTQNRLPLPTPCAGRTLSSDVSHPDCRRGDQAYAKTSLTTLDGYIFKPTDSNTSTRTAALSSPPELTLKHFGTIGSLFDILAARPPDKGDDFHKVGRSTGWTEGEIGDLEDKPERVDCPGNLRDDELDDRTGDLVDVGSKEELYVYMECIVYAEYLDDYGDSGSPVFVKPDDSSNDVVLVGVHVRLRTDPDAAGFVPIDMIYAESLAQGYDWLPVQLRPVPVLDQKGTGTEDAENLVRKGNVVTATFEEKDFSPRKVLTYEAALFRDGTAESNIVTRVSLAEPTVPDEDELVPVRRVVFSGLTLADGKYTVAVRACTTGTNSKCGGYGSHGNMSITVSSP